MKNNDSNIYDAKKSVKAHIKFFQALLRHLNGADEILKGRAMWASWCLHQYINTHFIPDIERTMRENKDRQDGQINEN